VAQHIFIQTNIAEQQWASIDYLFNYIV